MSNVIECTFKLIRATKRRPARGMHEFPPTVGRLLTVLSEHDGASSAELCEILDVRPSSMSELLSRVEEHGDIEKKGSETDKRVTNVYLTEKGKDIVAKIVEARENAEAEFSACFTDEEKAQFCALAEKLAAHLEANAPKHEGCHGHRPCPGRGFGPGHGFGPGRGFAPGNGPEGPHMHRHCR